MNTERLLASESEEMACDFIGRVRLDICCHVGHMNRTELQTKPNGSTIGPSTWNFWKDYKQSIQTQTWQYLTLVKNSVQAGLASLCQLQRTFRHGDALLLAVSELPQTYQ